MADRRVTDAGDVRVTGAGDTRVLNATADVAASTLFRRIAYAESTGDGEINLIDIDHEDLDEPLRFSDAGDVTHDGDLYQALWFTINAPALQGDGTASQSKLAVDVVDRRMIEAVRSITTPPTLTHFMVAHSDHEKVLRGPWRYEIRGEVTYDARTMELPLTFEPVLEEQCPRKVLSPSRAPGLF